MTEEEAKALEERQLEILAQLDEDESLVALKANERAKYVAAACDRFSTGGFLASLIAPTFSLLKDGPGMNPPILYFYYSACIVWFLVAIFLHFRGKKVLIEGLR